MIVGEADSVMEMPGTCEDPPEVEVQKRAHWEPSPGRISQQRSRKGRCSIAASRPQPRGQGGCRGAEEVRERS